MLVDDTSILQSEMLTNTVIGSFSHCVTLPPTTTPSSIPSTSHDFESRNTLLDMIRCATIESFWIAHFMTDTTSEVLKEKGTENNALHLIILNMYKLRKNSENAEEHDQCPCWGLNPDQLRLTPWEGVAVSLIYKLVLKNKCSINAKNAAGNAPLHLACMRPDASILVRHLIRLVKREDINGVKRYLGMGCRTICAQPTGESLYEAAMSTGEYDLVLEIDRMRSTNELIVASLALDLDYMQKLLSARSSESLQKK
ncbi:unnamed protein product [Echinostoma caproni]|uniref:ANK_REP_REGION domain-containing protein n=1 Tax=Echinostoma caproni TaxID=27848 RepID=A0A183ALI8_9TREM|nr:unnamed protein product [Echinostoma caproni]